MTTDEMAQQPRYRVSGPDPIAVFGIPEQPGYEFNHANAWPPNSGNGVEPVNEPARRILAWWKAHVFDAFKPDTPVSHGRYYLPGATADPRSQLITLVSPDRVLSSMPAYRSLRGYQHSIWDPVRRFPRSIEIGETIVTLRWPTFETGEFEPANPAAEAVTAYFEANATHPRLLASPWCEFAMDLFLPDLPGAATSVLGYGDYSVARTISTDPYMAGANRVIPARKPGRAA